MQARKIVLEILKKKTQEKGEDLDNISPPISQRKKKQKRINIK